jgi:hypothetical protein
MAVTDSSTQAALVFDCGQLAEALRSGDRKRKDDRTAVARFPAVLPLPEPAASVVWV